jgi:transposase InsO family protein
MCRGCETCVRYSNAQPAQPNYPNEWPHTPWTVLHTDIGGPICGRYLLVVIDSYSKWMEVKICNDIEAATLVKEFGDIFSTHGVPKILVSDNGPQYISGAFVTFCKYYGIKNSFTNPYHPRSNGLAERAVQSVKHAVAKLTHKGVKLPEAVRRFLMSYRSTPTTVTGDVQLGHG